MLVLDLWVQQSSKIVLSHTWIWTLRSWISCTYQPFMGICEFSRKEEKWVVLSYSSEFLLLGSCSLSPMPVFCLPELSAAQSLSKACPQLHVFWLEASPDTDARQDMTFFFNYFSLSFFYLICVLFGFCFFEVCIISLGLITCFFSGSKIQDDMELLFWYTILNIHNLQCISVLFFFSALRFCFGKYSSECQKQ